jgi:hypothetical protein
VTDLISNVIAFMGVLVTGYFTYLVYKATKATADVAEATLELSREIATKEEERVKNYRRIMRRQLVPYILKESQKVHDAVVDIDEMSIFRKLTNVAPKSLNIDMSELAEFFNEGEVKTITRAWETYDDYLRKYYKTGYNGNEMKVLLEKSTTVSLPFHELIELLKNVKFN